MRIPHVAGHTAVPYVELRQTDFKAIKTKKPLDNEGNNRLDRMCTSDKLDDFWKQRSTKEATMTTMTTTNTKKVLVLRTCTADLKSPATEAKGFQWPESGPVEAPDWDPLAACGNGLHGALWGDGNGSLFWWETDARWLVVEVDADQIVDLGGKVKFPRGVVVFCGDRVNATAFLTERAPGRAIIGGTATAGDYGTATAGYNGTATAGYNGTAMAGNYGTATAGDYGTATAGNYGTATARDYGTATAGYNGTATAGDNGTAMAGNYGTATAGDYGIIHLSYYKWRRRVVTLYVGEDGIEPNVYYKLDENNKPVKA